MLDTIITGDSGEVPATVNVCVTHWMIFMMPGRELQIYFLPVITNEPLAPELKVYWDFEFWKWYDTDTHYLYRSKSNHVKTLVQIKVSDKSSLTLASRLGLLCATYLCLSVMQISR